MDIHGLQKLTLLDFPGKLACTVFLAGCNYRCPFCHNAELIDRGAPVQMDDERLLSFLRTRQGMLDGVAFTGGEPLLSPGLPELIRKIRALGYAVKLDTNGSFPDRLRALLDEGLIDYAAMDIKNSPARYAETVGLPSCDLRPVRESVTLLMEGRVEYEFRTTAVAELHDADSFRAIGEWIRGARRWALQAFTDRDTVVYAGLHAPDTAALRQYAEIMRPCVDEVIVRGTEL